MRPRPLPHMYTHLIPLCINYWILMRRYCLNTHVHTAHSSGPVCINCWILMRHSCLNPCCLAGERLKELGGERPYAMLYYSTMPRATETAMVISESLPAVAMVSCDLLREGAPVRPDPPHKTWRPEEYVSRSETLSLCTGMCTGECHFCGLLLQSGRCYEAKICAFYSP